MNGTAAAQDRDAASIAPLTTGAYADPVSTAEPAQVEPAPSDTALATLLARMAVFHGRAVPAHRFAMTSVAAGGAPLESMTRPVRATELWLSAVPDGDAVELDEPPQRGELPVLWLANDGAAALLRGLQSNGAYSGELADGAAVEISPRRLAEGVVLRLTTGEPELAADEQPRSARDWFFHAIAKRKGIFVEAVLATGLVSVLALAVSMYTMQVYDRVVPTQGYSTLTVLTLGALLALALEFLMKQVRSRIVDRACKAIDQELSGVFFGRLLHIRMEARPRSVGTFAAQFKQFEMVRNFMTSSTLFLLADAPFVLFFIAVIYFIGGHLALVPLTLLPLSVVAGMVARWRIARSAEDQLRDMSHKNGLLVEAVDGIEAVKAVGGEWKMLDRWQQLTAEAAEKELRIRATSTAATNVTQVIQQLSYVSLIAVGAYAITTGQITMGALIACSIISNRALGPIAQISGLLVQWQHAKSALKTLDDMMALPTDRADASRMVIPERCAGELQLEAVEFKYTEQISALRDANLRIRPGERVAVVGPVGSGKSTLIKVLSGLYKPTEGRAFLDGVDMTQLAPEFMREHLGYLTQDVRLFSGTLRDNLTLGLPSPTDGQILTVAARTGLDRVIKSHPMGLDLPIAEGGRGLSGGQRQLVGLTRLMLQSPKVLLLDEPTASMDGELEAHVMRNVFLAQDKSSVILLATHKRSLLALVDRVLIMDQGRIMLDGPRDEVLAKLAAAHQAAAAAAAARRAPAAAAGAPAVAEGANS